MGVPSGMVASGSSWAEGDLVRRLCLALRVASRVTQELAQEGYADPDDRDVEVGSAKIIAETAMLLLATAPAGRRFPAVREEIEAVARLLSPHARSQRMRLGLCLRPALARDYGLAHICLTALDHPDAAFDGFLRTSLAAYEAESRERPPHRELEQQWIGRVWCGNSGHRRADGQLARHSMLGRPIDALNASRDDIYAFTHALLYATDLGRTAIRLPRAKRLLLADAEAALARCLDSEDYDLGGEVLLTWPLLGSAWNAAASFGFKVLARVEDEVGFLPAPLTRLDRYRSFERGEKRSRYVLATVYHTAYVMGLLCAITLGRGKLLPLKTWGRAGIGSEVDLGALLNLLHGGSTRPDGKDPHWLSDFEGLAPHEQSVLAPMLLTIALQRAAKNHDLNCMRDTLELGVRLGLVLGPGPHQAAQLLQRAAALSAHFTSAQYGE